MVLKARFAWVAAATAVAAACLWHARGTPTEHETAGQTAPFFFVRPLYAVPSEPTAQVAPQAASRAAGYEPLALGLELRYWFESHLMAAGDKTDEELRAQAESAIEQRFAPGQVVEAKLLLARYMDYRRAVQKMRRIRPRAVDRWKRNVRASNRFARRARSASSLDTDMAERLQPTCAAPAHCPPW